MAGERRGGPQGGSGWVVNSVSGAVVIGSVVQGRDITVQLPPQVPTGLNGWRAPTPEFVGRDDALTELLDVLAPTPPGDLAGGGTTAGAGAGARVALVTAAVAGLGGIGKTELALQAVHIALNNGWFSGGVLPIDLHGYAPAPTRLTVHQAIANLLRGLSVPDEVLPAAFDERVRMYRAVLAAYADLGTPILVVLDNAAPDTDLEDLIPGVGRAVVTSRHILAHLPARLLDLEVLSDHHATDLLARLLTSKRPTDTRAADHPEHAAQVAAACAGLPLAIHLVAALLATHPGMPLAVMAERLRDEATRLERIDEDRPGLRAAFTLSYQALPADQQRMFRLITCNPGPHISTRAAAATALLWPGEGERLVERLAQAHLLEPGELYGWWRMHDLVRQYATALSLEHSRTDYRDRALRRLLQHYLETTRAAAAHLNPTVADPATLGFATRQLALAWLDTELPNLDAAAHTAAATGHPDIAINLPLALASFLEWRRLFNDLITLSSLARDAAARTGNRHGEATALTYLGAALAEVRRFEEAITAHQTAAVMFREAGDREGEGGALNNLGLALAGARRFEEAITAHRRDLALRREAGERHDEGRALNNLGTALWQVRRFEEAITACRDAAVIFRETGDRHNEGGALNNLGSALTEVRQFGQAITAHKTAADILRETGDRHGEGQALSNLGLALRQSRRLEEALTAGQAAAAIHREIGDRHGLAQALNGLALTLRQLQRYEEAIPAYRQAAEIFRETGDRHGEGLALNNLGRALTEVRRFEDAIPVHQQAAAIHRETGDHHDQGQALNDLGAALQGLGRFGEAVTVHRDAAAIYRQTGEHHDEGITLHNLGVALRKARRFEEAVTAHRQAAAIFRRTGDRYGEGATLQNLGIALRQARRFEEAITVGQAAVTIFAEAGDEDNTAIARQVLEETLQARAAPEDQ
ncbi:tetratricopeptide repeat protein [Actinomadura litoris]|uniref:Tetratricopeptide repeat protein n=1 Tax=Actinomadura litoris TaxID=2678616 RepID=A0A7K1L903_9ACTN|nr:tetratricopeptide repeat protein [Actinomadura litoris]MUN40920.1 tetratricopeptide repeat protein [Actinomadura litoris]